MAKKCGKCDPHEICEECPEWIFTLADLIMCMMGLFVILWVLKTEGKPAAGDTRENMEYVKVAAAIRDAFGYIPNPNSQDPVDQQLILQKLQGERPPVGPGDKGDETQNSDKSTEGQDPSVTSVRPAKFNVVGVALIFEPGSSAVSREAQSKAREIASNLRGRKNIIVIKGHTSLDDLPDDATEQAKLELSFARARAVTDLLVAGGIAREVLRVQGCSTFEPARQRNFTPNGQASNRRVEVEVSDQLLEERQDPKSIILEPADKPASPPH